MTGELATRRAPMARGAAVPVGADDRDRVVIDGEAKLLEQLKAPLHRALAGRSAFYRVRVEGIGRCGEVLVGITGAKGSLPLLFGREELEPGYVARVVNDTLDRFAF
jgi:hypothetical protein